MDHGSHHGPGASCDRLPRPGRPGADGGPAPVPHGGRPLLAGYFVAVPEALRGPGLPRVARLTTASDCLIDRVPQDDCWFATAQEALAACAPVRVPARARLYALLVPAGHATDLVADIRAAATYEPVLLANLDGPGSRAPAREVVEGGHGIGWEVLGYDHGLMHSWLCNDLYRGAVLGLGVDTDERGLLPDQDTAERVAAWANGLGDTKPVTWFPAALIEWDTPIESRFAPVATDPPPPRTPWWHRLVPSHSPHEAERPPAR